MNIRSILTSTKPSMALTTASSVPVFPLMEPVVVFRKTLSSPAPRSNMYLPSPKYTVSFPDPVFMISSPPVEFE